jgi:hypothetical protein
MREWTSSLDQLYTYNPNDIREDTSAPTSRVGFRCVNTP